MAWSVGYGDIDPGCGFGLALLSCHGGEASRMFQGWLVCLAMWGCVSYALYMYMHMHMGFSIGPVVRSFQGAGMSLAWPGGTNT